jgi:quinol monooxygenase YgiN
MAEQTNPQATAAPAADADAPVYVVGYVDVLPPKQSAAIPALEQFRTACRQESSNQRCEIVRRLEQPNQFVTLQIWDRATSFDAHAQNPATIAIRDKFRPMLASPYDQRVHRALSVGPPRPLAPGLPLCVVTHVDVVPPRAADAAALLTRMAESGRKDAANARLEVLQQTNRPNHFSVVELWSDRKAFEAHAMTPAVIEFRNELQPMVGSLYDQRLYETLD